MSPEDLARIKRIEAVGPDVKALIAEVERMWVRERELLAHTRALETKLGRARTAIHWLVEDYHGVHD